MSDQFAAYWIVPAIAGAVFAVLYGLIWLLCASAKLGEPEDPRNGEEARRG
jgi:hypothetical protein